MARLRANAIVISVIHRDDFTMFSALLSHADRMTTNIRSYARVVREKEYPLENYGVASSVAKRDPSHPRAALASASFRPSCRASPFVATFQ